MLKPNDFKKTTSILAVVFFTVFMVTGPAAVYSFQTVFAHYGVQLDKCEDDNDYYDDNKKDCDRNFKKHDQEDDYCDDKEHDHNGHDNGDEWCDDHGQGKGNDNDCDDNGKDEERDDDNDNHHDDDCNDNGRDHDNDNGHDDRHNENGNNRATQSINQFQSSSQISQCVSGGSTAASCNNINLQNQDNSGNNAIAQD